MSVGLCSGFDRRSPSWSSSPTPTASPWPATGGIACSADARRFLDAGASLVQLYTGFVYGGPALPLRMLDELRSGA